MPTIKPCMKEDIIHCRIKSPENKNEEKNEKKIREKVKYNQI